MNLEPLAINNRSIRELFDFIIVSKLQRITVSKFQGFRMSKLQGFKSQQLIIPQFQNSQK